MSTGVLPYVNHAKTPDTGRNRSSIIWGDCPRSLFDIDGGEKGRVFYDDFLGYQNVSSAAVNGKGYLFFGDTGVTALQDDNLYGAVEIAGNDAAQDQGVIVTGANITGWANIAATAGKRLWHEQRIAVSAIEPSIFAGLGIVGLAADNLIFTDTTGALVSGAGVVGFRTLAASPSEIDCVYKEASGTIVEVKGNAATLVAGTYVKLGIKFIPREGIFWYIDGQLVGSLTDFTVTDFPWGINLASYFAVKSHTATTTAVPCQMDWWMGAQEE